MEEIHKVHPGGVYWLVGHSYGCAVALCVALKLEGLEAKVGAVFMCVPRGISNKVVHVDPLPWVHLWTICRNLAAMGYDISGVKVAEFLLDGINSYSPIDPISALSLNSYVPETFKNLALRRFALCGTMLHLPGTISYSASSILTAPVVVFHSKQKIPDRKDVHESSRCEIIMKAMMVSFFMNDEWSEHDLSLRCASITSVESDEGQDFSILLPPYVSRTSQHICQFRDKANHSHDIIQRDLVPTSTRIVEAGEVSKPHKQMPVALLFPGQGAQVVGMLAKAKELPAVKAMIEVANKILGYDLLALCLKGPLDKISRTEFCQPAILVASLAAVEMLRQENPEKVDNCQAVAGFSFGEVTALVFAGVLSLQDGLELIKLRAKAMQAASQMNGPQLMASIVGLPRVKVQSLIDEVKASHPQTVLQVANELFETGFSCSGSENAVEALAAHVKTNGGIATILRTGGAFHSKFMEPAVEPLTKACAALVPRLHPARCAIYSNMNAQPYDMAKPTTSFMDLVPKQIISPVLWSTLVRQMLDDGVTEFFELGPGKQLKAMMRRIDGNAWKTMCNVEP
eukprot:GEMP01031899.1.p1 GENE.GEMP01031899.1~~GEMP01031899.1.p1  ORF type:complete len:571 (+),score=70.67 GEMP01031899.1:144-1856(+)